MNLEYDLDRSQQLASLEKEIIEALKERGTTGYVSYGFNRQEGKSYANFSGRDKDNVEYVFQGMASDLDEHEANRRSLQDLYNKVTDPSDY